MLICSGHWSQTHTFSLPPCGGGLGRGVSANDGADLADERARALKSAPTEGERALWQLLRKRQLAGHRFRRQVPIGPFFVDFACLERRVIIEVDGSIHESDEIHRRDLARDRWITEQRFRVLRLEDGEVLENPEAAIQRIRDFLGLTPETECTTPTPTLPRQGGGC